MKKDKFFIGLLLTILFIVLQSTLFQRFTMLKVIPDVSLIFVVFCSYSFGSTKGEIIGFTSGILQDFLSTGPLGFNAISRTVIGFFYGKFKGKLFLDSFLLPILFIIIATIIKEAMFLLTSILFLSDSVSCFDKNFFIELGINAILSPIIFLLFKVFKIYKINGKEDF